MPPFLRHSINELQSKGRRPMETLRQGESFALAIDYERNSLRPARVFRAMTRMIEAVEALDRSLIGTFPIRVESVLLLEDVRMGSVRTVLRSVLKGVDDEAIHDVAWRETLGGFLLRGKHAIFQWIEGREQVEDRESVQALSREIVRLAEGTGVLRLPVYVPPPMPALLKDIAGLSKALSHLGHNDLATYEASGAISRINKKFRMDEEQTGALLAGEKVTRSSTVLLRVKKPVYIGESMWEFVHAGHGMRARIVDHEWVMEFQLLKIEVRPGDSLRVVLETTTEHDMSGPSPITTHRVLKVLEVRHATHASQLELPRPAAV
jgi:hypothetical protein